MMDRDDLHEQIMLFEELEAYFSHAHARPKDEVRREMLLKRVIQAKEKSVAEFNALEKSRTKAA